MSNRVQRRPLHRTNCCLELEPATAFTVTLLVSHCLLSPWRVTYHRLASASGITTKAGSKKQPGAVIQRLNCIWCILNYVSYVIVRVINAQHHDSQSLSRVNPTPASLPRWQLAARHRLRIPT